MKLHDMILLEVKREHFYSKHFAPLVRDAGLNHLG